MKNDEKWTSENNVDQKRCWEKRGNGVCLVGLNGRCVLKAPSAKSDKYYNHLIQLVTEIDEKYPDLPIQTDVVFH